MKYLLMTLAVVVMIAAPVLADQGNLSQNQLAKMGLSGMSVMSDTQGTAVRGMGFSLAFGAGYARSSNFIGQSGTVNGYLAVDAGRHGSLAGGANVSVTGGAIGINNNALWAVTGSGGASIAFTR